ncbi:MAG: hypothetical protein WKF63_09435, partial [Thermomicrobiales bacterium]
MTLILEIEDFLKETRCHIVNATRSDTVVLICVPQASSGSSTLKVAPPNTSRLDADDDELITWEDAA